MCVCIHISRVANKMGVNIESQNDGRGSIDRIAFPREDSSVQKRIFVSIRFEFFSLLPPPSPPFLLRLFTEASRIGGLRQYSFVLFEKLMDGCNLFAFIYLFIYFFCFVIYTKYYIIYLLIDTLTGYKLSKYIIKRNIFLYLYIFFTLYFILLLYPQLY